MHHSRARHPPQRAFSSSPHTTPRASPHTSTASTDTRIPTIADSRARFKPLAQFLPKGELKDYTPPPAKDTASKFRVYIHSTAPQFRDQTIREVRSLLSAAAPRHKPAPISTKGSQGILTDCTLRDIYVLSHGLRTADDVMIQVTKPKRRVGSFNKLIQGLQSMPIHAFAPRIVPPKRPHAIGKLTPAEEEADRLARERAEEPLLHNNVRVIINKSILSNQKAVKSFASETLRAMLTLKRGQQLKKRQVKYTTNPALFGKADFEVDETLELVRSEKERKRKEKEDERQQRKLQRRILRLESGETIHSRNLLGHKGNLTDEDHRLARMKHAWYGDDGEDGEDGADHSNDESAMLDDGYSINYNDFVKSDGEVDQERLRKALEDLIHRTQQRDGVLDDESGDGGDGSDASDSDTRHTANGLLSDDALHTISQHVKIMKTIQDDPKLSRGEKDALRQKVGTHLQLQDEREIEREDMRREALLRGDNVTLRRMQIEDEEREYETMHGIVDSDDDGDGDGHNDSDNDNDNDSDPTHRHHKPAKYSILDDDSFDISKFTDLGTFTDDDDDGVDVDLSFGSQYLAKGTNIPQFTEKDLPQLSPRSPSTHHHQQQQQQQQQHHYQQQQQLQASSSPSTSATRTRVRERPSEQDDTHADASIQRLLDDGPQPQPPPDTSPLHFRTEQTPTTPEKSYEEVDSDWTEGEIEFRQKAKRRRQRKQQQVSDSASTTATSTTAAAATKDPDSAEAQLEEALLKIAKSTATDAPLKASLLASAYSHVGTTGTEASKRILSTAARSIPSIHKFLPPEYRGLSDKKLKRRAKRDKYLVAQLARAKAKVDRIRRVLQTADARARAGIKAGNATDSMKLPSIMIPPRPHSDIPRGAMTITLERNVLRVSISAIGHRDQALYKRGYRTHLIETSMRETLAAGALSLAYDKMSPLHPTSPLAVLETDEFVTPIRKALHHLAKDVRVGRDPGDDHSAYALEEQNFFLNTAVNLLGEEEAQRQMLLALVEERRNVLSNPHSVREALEAERERQGLPPRDDATQPHDTSKPLTKAEASRNLISTKMLDDVVERIPADEIQRILEEGGGGAQGKPAALPGDGGDVTTTPRVQTIMDVAYPPEASYTHPSMDHGHAHATSTPTHHQHHHQPQKEQQSTNTGTTNPNTPSHPPSKSPTTQSSQTPAKDLLTVRPSDIIEAVSSLPAHHQAQAATALAAGLPFDRVAPLPSPLVTPIQRIAVHSRDHTPLSEVLAHTLSTGIIDADPAIRVFDPFCGSGTIVIESVFRFLGLPLAPLNRAFAFEGWPIHNEYEYNAMMREWKIQYQAIVDDFVAKFGLAKHQVLFNPDGSSSDPAFTHETLSSQFPLFIGSDLRDKSIRAAIHNSRAAGVNYFTHFIQSDFERMIRTAAAKWDEHQLKLSLGPSHRQGGGGAEHDTNDIPLDLNNPDLFTSFSLSDSRFDDYATMRRKQQQQQRHRQELPLHYPYLQGYTLFANIPWGVSDDKPARSHHTSDGRSVRVNTTQQESMEDLYIRLGKVLHDHGDMFRDVFILSAHQKFEKLTSIGAQRAARQQEREAAEGGPRNATGDDIRKKEIMPRNAAVVYQMRRKGELEWENVATFYNNGVKTHLLKLKM